MKRYGVKEIFYSLQGEGARSGTANVFVRFAGCNLACSKAVEGFDCDTDFKNGDRMTAEDILKAAVALAPARNRAVIFTGGEPLLQLDATLVALFKAAGFFVAIETNGMRKEPEGIDWISCSPKTPVDTLRITRADELRYVRAVGQGVPEPSEPLQWRATHLWLSPAFDSTKVEDPLAVEGEHELTEDNLAWCISLCLQNPRWRLSLQQHKIWKVR